MSKETMPIMKREAQGNILQDSQLDVTIRAAYSGSNMIYRGAARPGASESADVWQIVQLNYSGSNLVSKLYPQNSFGEASADYAFNWTNRAGYTFS